MELLDYDPKRYLETRLGDTVGEIAQALFAAGGGHNASDAPTRERPRPAYMLAMLATVALVAGHMVHRYPGGSHPLA